MKQEICMLSKSGCCSLTFAFAIKDVYVVDEKLLVILKFREEYEARLLKVYVETNVQKELSVNYFLIDPDFEFGQLYTDRDECITHIREASEITDLNDGQHNVRKLEIDKTESTQENKSAFFNNQGATKNRISQNNTNTAPISSYWPYCGIL